jgi:hypothetical protein
LRKLVFHTMDLNSGYKYQTATEIRPLIYNGF